MDDLSLNQQLELVKMEMAAKRALLNNDGLEAINVLITVIALNYRKENILRKMVETNLSIYR